MKELEIHMLYNIVKEEIDNWDAEALLKMGAPSDEYEIEIKDIVGEIELNNVVDEKHIAKVISDTFNYYFSGLGYVYTVDKTLPIARRITNKFKHAFEIVK